jgi:hypothetical protein
VPNFLAWHRRDLPNKIYQLLVRLYNWFNFPDEALPYTNEEQTTIEIGQIIAP